MDILTFVGGIYCLGDNTLLWNFCVLLPHFWLRWDSESLLHVVNIFGFFLDLFDPFFKAMFMHLNYCVVASIPLSYLFL